jgi:hypothetical protein
MPNLERRVEPEWLDELPADDPRAVKSRRDLRLVNRIMGNASILRRALEGAIAADTPRIAELGAGDGTLLLCALPPRMTGAEIIFVDRQPVVSAPTIAHFAERGHNASVAAADVFDWLSQENSSFDVIVCNLFLHHFEDSRLRELFALAARRTTALIACEPRRARIPLAGSRMLGLIGCNDVTRHDAHLSVRAGFAGDELRRLWPPGDEWKLEERMARVFSHFFSAVKR